MLSCNMALLMVALLQTATSAPNRPPNSLLEPEQLAGVDQRHLPLEDNISVMPFIPGYSSLPNNLSRDDNQTSISSALIKNEDNSSTTLGKLDSYVAPSMVSPENNEQNKKGNKECNGCQIGLILDKVHKEGNEELSKEDDKGGKQEDNKRDNKEANKRNNNKINKRDNKEVHFEDDEKDVNEFTKENNKGGPNEVQNEANKDQAGVTANEANNGDGMYIRPDFIIINNINKSDVLVERDTITKYLKPDYSIIASEYSSEGNHNEDSKEDHYKDNVEVIKGYNKENHYADNKGDHYEGDKEDNKGYNKGHYESNQENDCESDKQNNYWNKKEYNKGDNKNDNKGDSQRVPNEKHNEYNDDQGEVIADGANNEDGMHIRPDFIIHIIDKPDVLIRKDTITKYLKPGKSSQHDQSIRSKFYKPDYSMIPPIYPSKYHRLFVPSSSYHTDSYWNTDFPYRDHSRSVVLDDEEDNPDLGWSGSFYNDEEDDYSSEEHVEIPSNAPYGNHPPHVYKQVPVIPESSKRPLEHPKEGKRPGEQETQLKPETKLSPAQCRGGSSTIDVSVFSRAGLQKQQFNRLCEGHAGSYDNSKIATVSSQILLDIKKASSSPGVRLLPGDQCGLTVDERIVGGKEAELGAFPWVARIGYTRNVSNEESPLMYQCGGSLVNERYVITAAHCVVNLPSGLKVAGVRLGENDERSDPDCKTSEESWCAEPVQDFRPERVTVHPRFDTPKYSNDLALIRLDRPVRLSPYVSPICLPMGDLALKNYTGLQATVAGWGSTNPGVTSASPVLQWVRLGVVDTTMCAVTYGKTEAKLDPWRQLCAGGEAMADSCDGDSGGPLMRPEQPNPDSLPRYYLAGVVSFGPKQCGKANMPGVYTRVAAYLSWILDVLQP